MEWIDDSSKREENPKVEREKNDLKELRIC